MLFVGLMGGVLVFFLSMLCSSVLIRVWVLLMKVFFCVWLVKRNGRFRWGLVLLKVRGLVMGRSFVRIG